MQAAGRKMNSVFFALRRARPFASSIVGAPRCDSFWLFVVSRGGGLAKYLFHGFELDEMFDLSIDHRFEPLP